MDTDAEVRPPWLEWASSMMMANLRPPVLVADGVQDERELLDGGDNDPFALLEQGAEVACAFGMSHDRADLGELLDGVPYLPVQYLPVGNDDGRIEERFAVLRQPD